MTWMCPSSQVNQVAKLHFDTEVTRGCHDETDIGCITMAIMSEVERKTQICSVNMGSKCLSFRSDPFFLDPYNPCAYGSRARAEFRHRGKNGKAHYRGMQPAKVVVSGAPSFQNFWIAMLTD